MADAPESAIAETIAPLRVAAFNSLSVSASGRTLILGIVRLTLDLDLGVDACPFLFFSGECSSSGGVVCDSFFGVLSN